MAEQLWSDERISDEAGEATFEVDGSVYVRHIISQLLVKMRGDCQAALDAANQRIAELEAQAAWEPMPDGMVFHETDNIPAEWNYPAHTESVAFLVVRNSGTAIACGSMPGEDEQEVDLPDNIRLFRRKEGR